MVWQETNGGQTEILFSWSVAGLQGLSVPEMVNIDEIGAQKTPDIAYANGAFHIVWSEANTGLVRYRKATMSNFSFVAEENVGDATALWPNPATDVLHVSGGAWVRATIHDEQGKAVRTVKITSGAVNVATLAAGKYVLRLFENSGRTITRKFTKQ